MEKIEYKDFNEICYYEELENGLKVYIFHKPDFKTSSVAFGTPYGALNVHQKYYDKHYDFNPGIAHFLEHKVFEDEDGDVIDKFAALGANVNAFTSYTETVYYFSLTGKENFKESLNMLLDFVQTLNITDDSIEKEKPIINEEISMYQQMENTRLLNETYNSLYSSYPIIYDVGGDEKSVNSISKKELELCFNINYHPSNMIISITTFIDPEYIISIIRNNQKTKTFKKEAVALNDNPIENAKVNREYYEFNMDITTMKSVYAIKLNLGKITTDEAMRYENAIKTVLQLCFSNINPKYQEWISNKIITDYFSYEVEINEEIGYILFLDENKEAIELKKFIDKELASYVIDEKGFNQLKRRQIGNFFDEFNDIESFNITFIRYILDDVNMFDAQLEYQELDIETVESIFRNLNFDNFSLISLKPEK